MATQRNDLIIQDGATFSFTPRTLQEATEYATILANSGLCPESFRGKPNEVLVALQMGLELGLKPMQALRTLGVVNGVPFVYGDGALALIRKHTSFEWMKEWFEGEMKDDSLTALCTMKRRGHEPCTQRFSISDAKRAGLWTKKGVWQQYPKRMLQHRARGFAMKDTFPDALFGLMSESEAYDLAESRVVMDVPKTQTKAKGFAGLEATLGVNEPTIAEGEIVESPTNNIDELKALIVTHQVSESSIAKTLKKFCVDSIEALTDEMINKWINYLKSKESKL